MQQVARGPVTATWTGELTEQSGRKRDRDERWGERWRGRKQAKESSGLACAHILEREAMVMGWLGSWWPQR